MADGVFNVATSTRRRNAKISVCIFQEKYDVRRILTENEIFEPIKNGHGYRKKIESVNTMAKRHEPLASQSYKPSVSAGNGFIKTAGWLETTFARKRRRAAP